MKSWRKLLLITVVAVLFAVWCYHLLAVRGTFVRSRPISEAKGSAVLAGTTGHRIAGRVYLTGAPDPATPMVLVLHGDAPFVKPGYQYTFASELARVVPGTRVVAILRPGYADPYGAKSDGDRGFASGENYTAEVVHDVAGAIQSLRSRRAPSGVVLVGHSGGAAVAANIAGLYPGLVQHLFLVACPCDVPSFRRHMARLHWSPVWLLPVHSLSPLRTLEKMQPKGTKITAISGENDPITLLEYARVYIAKASTLGISASMITLPNKGHEILNDQAVIMLVAQAVRDDH